MTRISTIRSSATIIGVGTGYEWSCDSYFKKVQGKTKVSKAVGFWGREDHLRTVLLADAPINDGDVEVNTSSVARWPWKQAAINPNLNLFTIPPTDLSTASYRYVKVPPQTASVTPIHVYIEGQSDYIDLERSFVKLYLGFKTTGKCQCHFTQWHCESHGNSSQ